MTPDAMAAAMLAYSHAEAQLGQALLAAGMAASTLAWVVALAIVTRKRAGRS